MQPALLTQSPITTQKKQYPDAIAIETDDETITFKALQQRIDHLSMQLISANMKTGDRLVSIQPNGLSMVLLQLTCLHNGFVFCPINPQFTQTEIDERITQLNSTFIYQKKNPNGLTLDFSHATTTSTTESAHTFDPLAICNIIFTSGSSGKPKAVMHHFSNHYYSALGSQTVIPLNQGDKNLLSLPLFHISGYATVIRTLLAGATLCISKKQITVHTLNKKKITHLSLVTTQLQRLLENEGFQQKQLSIKHLLLGGSAFSSKILAATKARGFTYHLSYGSTEMASQIATSTNNDALTLLPYRTLKIENGEILLSGKTRFAGYFSGDIKNNLKDENSYFASADLGTFNQNTLKITGRQDRQFISGGENIQPEEIEKTLLEHEEVLQAIVLPIDNALFGQCPIAFIRWKKDPQTTQLASLACSRLTRYKQPTHYFSLPESQGIKVDLQALTEIALTLLLIN